MSIYLNIIFLKYYLAYAVWQWDMVFERERGFNSETNRESYGWSRTVARRFSI